MANSDLMTNKSRYYLTCTCLSIPSVPKVCVGSTLHTLRCSHSCLWCVSLGFLSFCCFLMQCEAFLPHQQQLDEMLFNAGLFLFKCHVVVIDATVC